MFHAFRDDVNLLVPHHANERADYAGFVVCLVCGDYSLQYDKFPDSLRKVKKMCFHQSLWRKESKISWFLIADPVEIPSIIDPEINQLHQSMTGSHANASNSVQAGSKKFTKPYFALTIPVGCKHGNRGSVCAGNELIGLVPRLKNSNLPTDLVAIQISVEFTFSRTALKTARAETAR